MAKPIVCNLFNSLTFSFECVFLEFFTPNLVPEYTIVQRSIEYRPHTEIPVREVEKYRYRRTDIFKLSVFV